MRNNIRKFIQIISIVFIIIGCVPWFLTVTECIDTGYHGFGVDSLGKVYLGKNSCICVYQDGVLLDIIQLPKYRYYWMTVEDEYIVIASDSKIETYTLQWSLVSEKSDYSADVYHSMRENHDSVTVNGIKYSIQSYWIQQTILDENGEVHYQTPRKEIAGSIGCSMFGVGLFCLIVIEFANAGLLQQLRDNLLEFYLTIRNS